MNYFLLLSILGAATALDFQGTGQLRTLQGLPSDGEGADLGCLTSAGQWTADESQCDVFTGVRTSNTSITLTNSAGSLCGLDNIKVVCQDGLASTSSKWMLFYGGGFMPIAGHDVLGYGEYGLMASTEDYTPISATDAPVSIEFWGDTDVQPFVYIGWQSA